MDLEHYMRIAIDEAALSLREGNHGFGAVIACGGEIIARAHDREETEGDPTSHAEMNAIRAASALRGKNLAGCILVSTHEPCPMCAAAIVWSGMREIAFGYAIRDALAQGRARIDMPCGEMFRRAGAEIVMREGVLREACALLYRDDVRSEVKRLRAADDDALRRYNDESAAKRIRWFDENRASFDFTVEDPVYAGYRLLLARFGISEREMPVVSRSEKRIVFHSKNFCPTLEACGLLGLDTGHVCAKYNEKSTDLLVKRIDSRLVFSRNYDTLRPRAEYCEEMISLGD